MDKIAISGLSAAGKTTHTILLAEALGFRTLHFTNMLLSESGMSSVSDKQIWLRRIQELEILRDHENLDRRIDARIAEDMHNGSRLVVDSMLSPWMSPDDTLRVWIGSDRLSRTWKCMVSYFPEEIGTLSAAHLIDDKDNLSRARFLRDYKIDVYSERSIFDFVLDNSHLIDEPTKSASCQGIASFHKIIFGCALAGLNRDLGALTHILGDPADASAIVSISPRMIEKLGLASMQTFALVPSRLS